MAVQSPVQNRYEYNYIVRVTCNKCGKSRDFPEKRVYYATNQGATGDLVAEIIRSCLWGCKP